MKHRPRATRASVLIVTLIVFIWLAPPRLALAQWVVLITAKKGGR
jgi:hypothetical protein